MTVMTTQIINPNCHPSVWQLHYQASWWWWFSVLVEALIMLMGRLHPRRFESPKNKQSKSLFVAGEDSSTNKVDDQSTL
jgi:hypothetical protein